MVEQPTRERGRVRWFKAAKGYGRITSTEFGDIVSCTFLRSLAMGSGRWPKVSMLSTRELQPGPTGARPVAIAVIVE